MTEADASGNAQGRSQVLPRKENNMGQFIVGKEYYPYQREYGAMKVIRRTEKTIWCEKDMVRWSMRIKLDPDGNEYAVDTCVPQRDRDAFTYMTDEEEQRWQK